MTTIERAMIDGIQGTVDQLRLATACCWVERRDALLNRYAIQRKALIEHRERVRAGVRSGRVFMGGR